MARQWDVVLEPLNNMLSDFDETFQNHFTMARSNLVKPDGTRKCRACVDGSKRAAPWLHRFTQKNSENQFHQCDLRLLAMLHEVDRNLAHTVRRSAPPTMVVRII